MKNFLIFLVATIFSSILSHSDAQVWSSAGNLIEGRVSCFQEYNGELYVGGQFYLSSSMPDVGLLKWNGLGFDTVPGTHLFGSCRVEAMTVYNGELIVGGGFCKGCWPVGSEFNRIARWDGNSWKSVATGLDNVVYAMTTYNDNLYVGGDIQNWGSIQFKGIAKWDGGALWKSVGNGIGGPGSRVKCMQVYENELYVGGGFTIPSLNTTGIARWNDTTWNNVGIGGISGNVNSLDVYNGDLYAGGSDFSQAGGTPVNGFAKWDGISWGAVGTGFNYGTRSGVIYALEPYHNKLYIGGQFLVVNGDTIKGIASFDGNSLSSVGSGLDSTYIVVDTNFAGPVYAPDRIFALHVFDGFLFVGGEFTIAGGIQALNIAKLSTPVGIDERSHENKIVVYPNPASNETSVTIMTSIKSGRIQLIDLKGIVLDDFQALPFNYIDISSIPSGIYFLKYFNSSQIITRKLVVTK